MTPNPDPKFVAAVGGETPEAKYNTLTGYFGDDPESWKVLAENEHLPPELRQLIKERHQ